MYILCHLSAGIVIGIILFWYVRDPILIVAAAIGSILPDLIDKPLGYIVFEKTLDYGRIYAHTLLFSLIVLFTGLIIWRRYGSLAGVALALGLLSHALLDAMWLEPANWYYPFLGPFQGKHVENFFLSGLVEELTNPSEWLFAAAVLLILVCILKARGFPFIRRHERFFFVFSLLLIAILVGAGLIILYAAMTGAFSILTGWTDQRDNLFAGVVMVGIAIIAAAGLWYERLCTPAPDAPES
jgi:membrane-bound metal-dependent hydrolase YbcI (DUF457 family)